MPSKPGSRKAATTRRGARKGAGTSARGKPKPSGASAGAKRRPSGRASASSSRPAPKLLSGGNPQIAKADGDAPVQAYIAAMPGWKREVGARLDALIERAVPDVQKAVRWNSPFYGMEGRGWFASYHCFTKYVKVTFFKGQALRPVPPIGSKDPDARYVHIVEDGEMDEARLSEWFRQAASRPGWIP